NSAWEMMVFNSFLVLLMFVPFQPFNFQPSAVAGKIFDQMQNGGGGGGGAPQAASAMPSQAQGGAMEAGKPMMAMNPVSTPASTNRQTSASERGTDPVVAASHAASEAPPDQGEENDGPPLTVAAADAGEGVSRGNSFAEAAGLPPMENAKQAG